MLLVILNGGIDLSVGSIVGLSGVVAGVLLEGLHLGVRRLIALPAGVGRDHRARLAVGTLRRRWSTASWSPGFNVAPFIATLGMLYVARGVALLISNGATYPEPGRQPAAGQHGLRLLGSGRPLGLPIGDLADDRLRRSPSTCCSRKTPFGRWLYATGGNERAARAVRRAGPAGQDPRLHDLRRSAPRWPA